MKRYQHNKILPLTVKQLKKAQLLYRQRNSQIYERVSYQFITIVARVVKVTNMEIRLTDQTQILDIEFHLTSIRKACKPLKGQYYKISFFPKRIPLISNYLDFISLQIVGIMRVNPNEITNHLIAFLQEKLERQNLNLNQKIKDQITRTQIPINQMVMSSSSPSKTNGASNSNSKKANGEYEITKYCKQLEAQFNVETIFKDFGHKYSIKDIENVLEKLSDKGCIMDLGIVYQWVGQEE